MKGDSTYNFNSCYACIFLLHLFSRIMRENDHFSKALKKNIVLQSLTDCFLLFPTSLPFIMSRTPEKLTYILKNYKTCSIII